MEERLQKILARAGFGSRRECETLITAGRVSVNGRIAVLGSKADASSDRILLDGQPVALPEPLTYVALYKPQDVLSTTAEGGRRQTVVDLVNLPVRLYPVGRLDADSEGLILLTNDGELTDRLTHPRYGHEKEYHVLVDRRPDEEQFNIWRRGVVLADGHRTQPAQVDLLGSEGKNAWLRITLREGRKRQIREVGARLGLLVLRIVRVRIGALQLGSLTPGQWRMLTDAEVEGLKRRSPAEAASGAKKASILSKRRPARGGFNRGK